MMLQRIVLGLYFFSILNLQSSNQVEKPLTSERVLDGILARVGTVQLNEVSWYIEKQYEQVSDGEKKIGGRARNLAAFKKHDEALKNKQAYVLFAMLPIDLKKYILQNEMQLNDPKVLDKAVLMPMHALFELYAECKWERLASISCIPLATRFLCSKEQLQCVRGIVCNSMMPIKDVGKYYDLEKKIYYAPVYEVTAKEKELIVTLPQEFMQQANTFQHLKVVEKEHALKKGFKASLALALNQGRYRIFFDNNTKALQLSGVALLRLASLLILNNFNIISGGACGLFVSFQVCGPIGLYSRGHMFGRDRAITLLIHDKHRWALGITSYGGMNLLNLIMNKIKGHDISHFIQNIMLTKRDGLIIGGLLGAGMTWDYCKYGVTYGCKTTTLGQLWSDAQQHNKTTIRKSYCSIL